MINSSRDTICAVCTPVGVGGVSIVRVSGSRAWEISSQLAPSVPEEPESHRAYFSAFVDSEHETIDEGLILLFAKGRSYTGDQTAEINCHGNPSIVEDLIRQLVRLGCRPASRGEFTMRAFLNGRLDLAQAESVLSLIESESLAGRRISLRQLKGDMSRRFEEIESGIVDCLAQIEASIDFSTEDIEVADHSAISNRLSAIDGCVGALLDSFDVGRNIHRPFIVSLVGAPNAGKSSLLNALVERERAIVSEVAGTTRDVVEASLKLNGREVLFRDTAGLRDAADAIEAEGIRRSLASAHESDLVLTVIDSNIAVDAEGTLNGVRRIGEALQVVVLNKVDLLGPSDVDPRAMGDHPVFRVSAKTRYGIDQLIEHIASAAKGSYSGEMSVITNARHFEGLKKVQARLRGADLALRSGYSSDLVAFDLREALLAIQILLGKQFEESVIDRIFSAFCIGK